MVPVDYTCYLQVVHVTRRLYILPTGCTCYLWIVHVTYLACYDSCVHVLFCRRHSLFFDPSIWYKHIYIFTYLP